MSADTKRKALHYRRSVLLPNVEQGESQPLQMRLDRAYRHQLTSVESRCFFCDIADDRQDEGDFKKDPHFFISKAEEKFSMFCAEIMYVEPGNSVATIVADYSVKDLESESLPATHELGLDSREYLESVAYISVIDNHVIILQSKAIRIKDIENYINHILKKTNELNKSELVLLQVNSLSSSSVSLNNNKVKRIKLSLPMAHSPSTADFEDGYRVLETLVGEERLSSIKNSMGIDISDLMVDISIGYKYSTSSSNEQILEHLAKDFIDNRDEDLVIELKGAGRIVGEEVQVKEYKYVPYRNNQPVKEAVYEMMTSWLISLLERGNIEP
ncbi:hypothetical protein [Enterobacter sp.]|uniref:hypothetical protein n=1 Tax=Enterobacter sp. TaxID=42895 RepID=UPI00296F50D5|nr:hypothetical protein [Enterobacter sp.]